MQSMEIIRTWQFESMENTLLSVGSLLQFVPLADLTRYRDGGTGWTVTEVLCHLRDFEALYMERAELTIMQEFPSLPFPNPDLLAQERKYNQQDPHAVYAEWVALREAFLKFLRKLDENAWERPANHPSRGRFTLNDQLFLAAWHNVNHIEQITRILAEKQTGA